jgi:hypothetical protein
MTIPTTYLSLHDVTGLKAAALQSFETPLILTIDSPHGAMQISFYLRDRDAATVEALADVINTVMKAPEPPQAACPVERAAYAASDEYYARLRADLDRHPIEKVR